MEDAGEWLEENDRGKVVKAQGGLPLPTDEGLLPFGEEEP